MFQKLKIALRILSAAAFVVGVFFAVWSLIGLNAYFNPQRANRLPPAGSFIDGPTSFTFAVMSDSGFRNEPLNAVIADARKRKPAFILHLGDQARRLESNHFEHMLQELDDQLGDTPFYAIPGNHDVLRSGVSNYAHYQRAFGQPNYWFSYGDVLFIALDTALSRFDAPQQKWLENVFEHLRGEFKTCVVIMHVPPEDPRPNKSYALERDVDELRTILKKHKPDLIVAGHIHEYNRGEFAGIPMVIAPPCGQKMRGKTTMFGYLLCEVRADGSIDVKKIDVTDKTGRDYLAYHLSTGMDGITSAGIAFLLLTIAFILLLVGVFLPEDAKPRLGKMKKQ